MRRETKGRDDETGERDGKRGTERHEGASITGRREARSGGAGPGRPYELARIPARPETYTHEGVAADERRKHRYLDATLCSLWSFSFLDKDNQNV